MNDITTNTVASFFRKRFYITIVLFSFLFISSANAQVRDSLVIKGDSTIIVSEVKTDSAGVIKDSVVKKRVYVPRVAAIRSAILPGLGQIYNRRYWKLPLVYAALGITGYVFFDNLKTYKTYRFAYQARYKASLPNATAADSIDFNKLDPFYQQPSIRMEALRTGRDKFRQYIDYSVLFFVVFWGLNVVDATVDAHLRGFDVSPDLTLKFKAGYSEMAGTNGVSLVLKFRDRHGR